MWTNIKLVLSSHCKILLINKIECISTFRKLSFMQDGFDKYLTQTKYNKRSEMTETKPINVNQSFFSNQIISQNVIQITNNSNDLDKINRISHNQLKLSLNSSHKTVKMLQNWNFCQINVNIEQTRISALTIIILIIISEIASIHSIQIVQDFKRKVLLRSSHFEIENNHNLVLIMWKHNQHVFLMIAMLASFIQLMIQMMSLD